MTRARRPLAAWLAVLAGVSLALGVTGLWAQRTLGDPETFAGLAGDILEQPVIQQELAIVIVDPALAQAPAEVQQQRTFILATTASILGSAKFIPVFEDVLRRAATRLVEGHGPVRLELDRPLALVVTEAERFSPELAAELATIDSPEPEVISEAKADRLREFLAFERAMSLAFLVIGVGLVVVAVAVGGGRELLPFGASLAGACLLLLGLLLLGRTLLLAGIQPASRADAAETAWDIVIGDLRTALFVCTGAGAVAVVAGGVLGRRG